MSYFEGTKQNLKNILDIIWKIKFLTNWTTKMSWFSYDHEKKFIFLQFIFDITIIFFQQKVNNSIFQHPNKSEWAILQSILGCYKFFYWVDLPEAFNVQCFCLKYKFTAIKLQYAKSLSLYTWFKSLNIIRDPHASRIIIKGQKTYWLQ